MTEYQGLDLDSCLKQVRYKNIYILKLFSDIGNRPHKTVIAK